ncbi:hypothetical protein SKDZ_12G3040 [Saccharomyces kudriavzevii ZP591]|nr:hypothetical protein SKDZ_12G3040 [Saccharomyces kudriavzevii ZP591]
MPVSSLNYSHGKKLKPSLKLSKTASISSFVSSTPSNSFSPLEDSTSASSSASSSSSEKLVRFATHLYTVKKFNTKLAPISISEKVVNVPPKYITSHLANNVHNDSLSSNFSLIDGEDHPYRLDVLENSDLEYYDEDDRYESESDFEDDKMFILNRDFFLEKEGLHLGKENKFDIADWKLISSNLNLFKDNNITYLAELERRIFEYLNGQNIKVHLLELSDPVTYEDICRNNLGSCQISGLIFVNNLNFEKIIEIKFTLNNWTDIHYINAHFNKSITSRVDEFKFVIDISALKLNLVSKNLIYSNLFEKKTTCSLNLQFCCRYDVNNFNNKTFYDNNDYRNYEVTISLSAISLNREVKKFPKHDSNLDSFMLRGGNTNVHVLKNDENIKKPLRKFNDDTDYFNDSPLKHKFHKSLGAKVAYNGQYVLSSTKTKMSDCGMKPFDYLVEPPESQTDEDTSDSPYDLSLQDFNYWEFTNHGLEKAMADLDILQFKNYSKPISRHPTIDDSFTLRTGNSTLRSETQELEDDFSSQEKSVVTTTPLNGMQIHDDEFEASLSYINWNNSTDTLMKKNDRQSIEPSSPSQLSIATIRMEENLLNQENSVGNNMYSFPAFSPLKDSTPLPFLPSDGINDDIREREENIFFSSNEIHFPRDYFSKSPSPSPSPIYS